MEAEAPQCQAVFLAPTREAASAIWKTVNAIGEYLKVKCACFDQKLTESDRDALESGVHCIVGTPRRICSMLQSGAISPDCVKQVILDEADGMLVRGHKESIDECFSLLPAISSNTVQVVVVSHTMPPSVLSLIKKFMRRPIEIEIKRDFDVLLEKLGKQRHCYLRVERDECKLAALLDLFDSLSPRLVIVFCNTYRKAEWLATELQSQGFSAASIGGAMSINELGVACRHFRTGTTQILVTTDHVCDKIQACEVSLVLNFDMPGTSPEGYYIMRCVQTVQSVGTVINFTTDSVEDSHAFTAIETLCKIKIQSGFD